MPPALSPEEIERVQQVFLWIINGATEHQVRQAITATWPDQEGQPLIVAALDQITANGSLNPQLIRGWCFEASRELYRKMAEIGDFAGALRAVKQIQQMVGKE